ncbi:serine/threonine-protein kinase [Hyalangium rubrum]|uniref:non-specific serine/threonine protein kinase n=1 Tax=Hyalangium rubrum TaxID=3103134 RepID=A0ABU5H924_9BACT|nr:protein kinase [Hyalangium sp. s54d21]MDY7229627.1 protein kinase [Hyalangium sp. s54d21]
MRVGPVENQGSNANISRSKVGNITHVRISGVIDETFPLTSSSAELNGIIIIDLGCVDRISSFGVRKWIEFASKLPSGAIGMYMVYAPPVVVDQLNMVEGFAGVARVLSVLAPYTCKTCGEDRMRSVNLLDEAQAISESRAPEHTCPVCTNPLEFADLPGEFFDYARRQHLGTVDPVVMRYLRLSVAAEPLDLPTHLKIVQDDITYVTLASVIRGDLNVRRLASGLEGRVAFDFSHVAKVELEGVLKLEQVLETASKGAQVVLCRVPPAVLSPMAKSGKQLPARIHTLWLPYECQNCGQVHHQRAHASTFLQQLKANEGQERPCAVCGGASRLANIPNLAQFLSRMPLTDRPLEDIEALEGKSVTQFLFGSATAEQAPQGGNNTDISGSHGASKLQIIRRLGQGGMAEVFLAKQVGVKGFEKFLVMKKILQQFAENPEFVDMLFAEARANARLTHPNVVQTFDVGVTEGVAYILMEYVRGPDLKRLMNELRRKGLALPMEHALRIVAETSAGLHYAHSYVDPAGNAHPVVHRDVSPHNILISLDGAIKLSDFGIAKVQGEDHTQAGVLKGKISYISPEAAAGRPLDARNDVFALGVVLFELLTGQLPFRRDHDAATLNAIVREPAPVPSQLKPSIPQDVSDLILRALVKDPSRRTSSAAALREEIEAVMAHHRLNSSPAAVAQFFKDTLGDRLVEYAPATASSGSGSHPRITTGGGEPSANTSSSARLAGAVASSGTGSGSRPNLTGSRPGLTGSRPGVGTGTGTGSRSGSGPRPIPAAPPQPQQQQQPIAAAAGAMAAAPDASSGMEVERTEQVKVKQGASPQARPSQTGARAVGVAVPQGAQQQPQASSGSTRSGIRQGPATPPPIASAPPPATMAPAPQPSRPSVAVPAVAAAPAPVARASTQVATVQSAPARSAPVHAPSSVGIPAVAPTAVQPAPRPAAVVHEPPPPASSRKWIVGLVAALAIVAVVGVAGVTLLGNSGGIDVVNLSSNERLYIEGLLVDKHTPRIEKPGTLRVSTAVDGRLRRFGTTERRDRIDVNTIPEALPQPGSTGKLSVAASAPGCRVKVGEEMLSGSPPLETSIEAGKELEVLITCPSQPMRSQWVMAVRGQTVEIQSQTQP